MSIKKIIIYFSITMAMVISFVSVTFGAVPYKSLYYDEKMNSYSNESIFLNINGEEIENSKLPIQPIIIDDGRVLVPLREVFQNIGATVNYDETNQQVTIQNGEDSVIVKVNSNIGFVNGKMIEMDTSPKFVALDTVSAKKVMIPLRFVGEGLGVEVGYKPSIRTVFINTNKNSQETVNLESNASSVLFKVGITEDVFEIKGETHAPKLYAVTPIDDYTMYIDIQRPNTILNETNTVIEESVNGVGVDSYKIYNLDDEITRIKVTTKGEYIFNVIENGKLTKVYVKPKAVLLDNNTSEITSNTTDSKVMPIVVTQSNDSVTLKLNKSKNNIPKDFNIKDIIHTDEYMQDKYTLTFPMPLDETLSSYMYLPLQNTILNDISIAFTNYKTDFKFNGKNVLYADVTENNEDIIITLKMARAVYDKIIVLDAGHGGVAPGKVGVVNGKTYLEKDLAYDMTNKTAKLIEKDTRFKVYLTRPYDIDVDFYVRSGFSTHIKADMFISIHVNGATVTSANGIETYYFDIMSADKADLTNRGIKITEERKITTAESKAFADEIQKNLISATGLKDRKVQHGNFAVLRSNEVPAILIETGFLSNQKDALKLVDEKYRTQVAEVVAKTVIGYYNKY